MGRVAHSRDADGNAEGYEVTLPVVVKAPQSQKACASLRPAHLPHSSQSRA